MSAFLSLIAGLVGGVFLNILAMKINFQQRTIDNKIKVFDSLIMKWVQMRNHLVRLKAVENDKYGWWDELDKMYGESLVYLGEAILVSNNEELLLDIEDFNEKFYRSNWINLSREKINENLKNLKEEGMKLIHRMRHDVKKSAHVSLKEVFFAFWKDS